MVNGLVSDHGKLSKIHYLLDTYCFPSLLLDTSPQASNRVKLTALIQGKGKVLDCMLCHTHKAEVLFIYIQIWGGGRETGTMQNSGQTDHFLLLPQLGLDLMAEELTMCRNKSLAHHQEQLYFAHTAYESKHCAGTHL